MMNRTTLVRLAISVASLATLSLPGCATRDAAWVHDNLELIENFHAGTKVLVTPNLPDTGAHEAQLRATARTRGNRQGAEIALTVRAEFDDFSFLDRVSFANGRAFPLDVERRVTDDCGTTDKSLCNVYEYVSVKLPRKYLMAKRSSGFNVKLWGRRDSVALFVPPQYIEGLLARMEHRVPEDLVQPALVEQPDEGPAPASPASSRSW